MSVFASTSFATAAARVESIRTAHRQRNWGDIGYHFLIDPAGRVWQGRSTSWQGAHVKDGNVGNLGICVMGNYQSQTPTEIQLKSIEDLLSAQMKYFSISADRIHTHQELRPTACPGRSLQPRIASIRGGRVLQSI
jgi:N-acetyl-anhydromuramyl-L-alanine amidase AmpD